MLVLNEIDPLSQLGFNLRQPAFRPTDILSLVREGDHLVSDDLLIKLFLESLAALHKEMTASGRRLLLRDHSHSHFFAGSSIARRPSLHTILQSRFSTISIVTVRNPVDSFLSLIQSEWMHFSAARFDEYCFRYHAFLDEHAGVPIFKYEHFVSEPLAEAKRMCECLGLSYSDAFIETFDFFAFSGDSGRTGNVIEPRPRRPLDDAFLDIANRSRQYEKLAARLGYERQCPVAC